MNRENLYDAVTEVSDEHLNRADARHEQKKSVARRRWRRAAVAAVLVIAVLGGVVIHSFTGGGGVVGPKAYAVALAEYPDMAPYPGNDGNYAAWREDQAAQRGPKGYADGLDAFFAATIREFLSDTDGENKVYSPLNVYMALAMLAEVTDGESRTQVLELLGHTGVESLREQAGYLWNANYRKDGATTSVLASSVWLNEDVEFRKDTLNRLAEQYYASSYQGTMGSEEYNQALRDWLNEQTGGLLAEQAAEQEMDPQTILALAATVYFQAKWAYRFSAEKNTMDVFHAPEGDVTVEFMHHTERETDYYWGERFAAVPQRLENAGSMWFILPDEDVTVDDLLTDPEAMAFLLSNGRDWENSRFLRVNESIPKFDVVSKTDLKDGLQDLGVTDVFDETNADFSPVTDAEPVWVSAVDHAARVVIDEEGCTAAAYTVMVADGAALPPDEVVDFVVDRPFLFVLTGIDGLPLFVGIVNNP